MFSKRRIIIESEERPEIRSALGQRTEVEIGDKRKLRAFQTLAWSGIDFAKI